MATRTPPPSSPSALAAALHDLAAAVRQDPHATLAVPSPVWLAVDAALRAYTVALEQAKP